MLSDRICVFESLSWNLVHAEVVDEIMGYEIPVRAKYIRVLMAELTRLQSRLIWIGAISLEAGLYTVFKLAIGYRDLILGLFEAVTGARVYPAGYVRPGGVRWDLPRGFSARCPEVLDKVGALLTSL